MVQFHVASALEHLASSLHAAGVGSLSPIPLPGTEDPDLMTAYAAMLLGRYAWLVMGPQRLEALLTFGGTLATISPTASRVIESWLEQLGSEEGSILAGLVMRRVAREPKPWVVGPKGDGCNLSGEGMYALFKLLLGVQELYQAEGVDGEAGGLQPAAWISLLCIPKGGCVPGAEAAGVAGRSETATYRKAREQLIEGYSVLPSIRALPRAVGEELMIQERTLQLKTTMCTCICLQPALPPPCFPPCLVFGPSLSGDDRALAKLIKTHLPGLVLHPHIICIPNDRSASWAVTLVDAPNRFYRPQAPDESQKVVLVTSCMPRKQKAFTIHDCDMYLDK